MSKITPFLFGLLLTPVMALAILLGFAWGNHVDTGVAQAPRVTYAECQASAEYSGFTDSQGTTYSGGRYAVGYVNGVCTVQKP